MSVDRTLPPRTSQAIAANELRGAILRGDLSPGAKIRQEATAHELGVSLIPLREALKTLAGEGTVTYHPQRGYFVTELPDEAIAQIYVVRALLESETERIAVPRIGEQETAALRTELRTQERAVEDRDAVEMIAANRRFHFTIFERCENPWLLRFVAQLWDAVDPYRVLSYRRMFLEGNEQLVPEEILTEHDGIITALELREPDRALHLLEDHRKRSQTFVTVLLDPAEQSP
jgi:DNA-binding GntR family transcriptional regulator